MNLHGKSIEIKKKSHVTAVMKVLEKERGRMTINCLPSTATIRVRKLVEHLTRDREAEVFKLQDFSGRCFMLSC